MLGRGSIAITPNTGEFMGKSKMASKKKLVKAAKKSAKSAFAEAKKSGKGASKTLKAEGKAAAKKMKREKKTGHKKAVVLTAALFAGGYFAARKLGFFEDEEDDRFER